eukprot:1483600-Pleurochrysis_carterae.AAC.1
MARVRSAGPRGRVHDPPRTRLRGVCMGVRVRSTDPSLRVRVPPCSHLSVCGECASARPTRAGAFPCLHGVCKRTSSRAHRA